MIRIIITIALSALCLGARADGTVHGAVCDGCSNTQMAARASSVSKEGTVYVFNPLAVKVRKYEVFTEVLDLTPYTIWTQALSVQAEAGLQSAFSDFVSSLSDLEAHGAVELPPDFPVLSVAGALVEPGSTATHIEQYLRQLQLSRQLEIDLGVLASNILKRNIPLVDLSSLFRVVKITLQFPDGSSQDYEIYYSLDARSGEARVEVSEAGNALMPDGSPAPTGPLGFDGLVIRDFNGSLQEWLMWAQLNRASISGPGNGTTMTCRVEGGVIHCIVRNRG